MIVVDASVVIEVLLRTELGERVQTRVLDPDQRLHAPHVLDLEITQVLRRMVQLKELAPARADEALEDFFALLIERAGHRELLLRIWELRESLTSYDGAYVALGEALDAPVLTCDARLARAHGHRARVELVA